MWFFFDMNLHDFIHLFVVLAVSSLLFGTKDDLLFTFFESGFFKDSEKEINDKLKKLQSEKEDEIEKSVKPIDKDVVGNISSPIKKSGDVQAKLMLYRRRKGILKKRYNELIKGEWANLSNTSKKEFKDLGARFKAVCLFIGLVLINLIIISSYCHFYCEQNSHQQVFAPVLSMDFLILTYYCLIKRQPQTNIYITPLGAIICYIMASILTLAPYLLFIVMGLLKFNGSAIRWVLFIFSIFPLIPLLWKNFRKWKMFLILGLIAIIIQDFYLIYFSDIAVLIPTYWIAFIIITFTLILVLSPWAFCFYHVYLHNKEYEGKRKTESQKIIDDLTSIAKTVVAINKTDQT